MADPRPLEPLSSGGSHDRRRPGRWAAATAGVLVVAVGGWQAADAASAVGPSYRTAAVGRGNVDETISSTGTIASVTSSSLSFALAGRVANVLVAPGQHLAAGQVLAQLDTASLLAQLAQDRSTVAADQAKLAADQASETGTATPSTAAGTVTAGSTTAAATAQPASAGSALTAVPATLTTATGTFRFSPAAYSSRPSSGSPSAASAGTGSLRNQITVLQAKLGSDQHGADEPLLQAQAELRSATTTCAPLLSVLGGATVAAPTAYGPPRRGIFTVEPAALSTAASAGPSPSSATSPQSSTGTWSGTGAGSGTHTDGGTGIGTGARGSGSGTGGPGDGTGTSPGGGISSSAAAAAACAAVLTKVMNEQNQVASAQDAVGADEHALSALLTQLEALAPASGGKGSPAGTGNNPAAPGVTGGSAGSPAGSGGRTRAAGSGEAGGPGATGSGGSPAGSGGRTGGASSSSRTGATGSGKAGAAGSRAASGSSTIRSGSTAAGGAEGSGGSTGSRAGSAPATPEQLAADQANIDAASAELAQEQQTLQQAQLVSPITGTVATVGVATGQSVSANSTSAQVLVVAPGAFEVTTNVPDTKIGQVKVGSRVTVTPDGVQAPQSGRVVAVGLLPTAAASSSSSVTYPVTVGFDNTPSGLFTGSGADVSIVLASASGALTVPSSAIRTVGGNHIVTVLRAGKTSTAVVTLGAVGPSLSQVTAGLTAGERVVLANLKQALPTSTTTSTRGLGLAGGGGTGAGAGRGAATGGRAVGGAG